MCDQELEKEIHGSIESHKRLLEYSEQSDTLILPSETMEQATSRNWTQEGMLILSEHLAYHEKMIILIQQIKNKECVNKVPSPPKRKLKDLLDERLGEKTKQDKLTPRGLHIYLQQHIQDMKFSVSREAFKFQVGQNVTIDQGIKQLKEAYKHLCRQNAQSMFMNSEFGDFLNELYQWYEGMKINGHIVVSWQMWLNTHINISASHARNLRQLCTIIKSYPKLKTLDLPLN